MLKKLLTAIALVAALPVAAQFYESKRVSAYDYECQSAEGKFISGHQRPDTARAACEAWSIENGLAPFRIEGGAYSFVPTALAQQVGIGSGIPDSLGIPVWSNIAVDPIEIEVGEAYSLDLSEHCFVPDAFGNDTGATPTFALVSGSVSGLSLAGSVYSGTPDTETSGPVEFSCAAGTTVKTRLQFEVTRQPVETPALGQPIVVGADQIDIPLAEPWDSANTPISYSLEQDEDCDGGYTEIASGTDIFDGGAGYSDTGLTAETQYCYRTIATDSTEATSEYSEVVSATTDAEPDPELDPPSAPSNVAVDTVGETTIEGISWTPGDGSTSTRVIVAVASGDGNPSPGTFVLDTTTTESSYPIVSGLDPEQWYYVRVCSINAAGQGCANRVYVETLADPGEEPPVSSAIIFQWDYSSEPLGLAVNIGNIWVSNTPPNPPLAGEHDWSIKDDNPLTTTGGKYFQSTFDKSITTGTQRAERRFKKGTKIADIKAINAGGGDVRAEYKYWVGFLFRIDNAGTNNDNPRGFYFQTHSPSFIGNSTSPVIAMRGAGDSLRIYRKEKANSTPGGAANYTDNYSAKFLTNNQWRGKVHAFIMEYYMDGRSLANGGQGVVRVWINSCSNMVYEHLGRNITWGLDDLNGNMEMGYANHGNYSVGTHTGLYTQSFDNIVVMDENGSCSAMLDAIDYANRTGQ